MILISTIAVLMASGVVARGVFLLTKVDGESDPYRKWCKEPEPKLGVVK